MISTMTSEDRDGGVDGDHGDSSQRANGLLSTASVGWLATVPVRRTRRPAGMCHAGAMSFPAYSTGSYPPDVYTGEGGEATAWLRPSDTPPDLDLRDRRHLRVPRHR